MGAGEAGSGSWEEDEVVEVDGLGEREEGEDGSGMSVKVLSMGSWDNFGRFEGEVSLVLTRGDAGE